MKDDKTTPSHDLTPRADGDVTDSGSPLHSKRRTLLKKTGTVTATAALATWLLPKQWQKPVIDVVGLPLHAQTSPAVATTVATTRATTTEATTTEATTTEATTTQATTTQATTTAATTTGAATTTVATTTVATTTVAPKTRVTGYTLTLLVRTVIHNIILTDTVAFSDLAIQITGAGAKSLELNDDNTVISSPALNVVQIMVTDVIPTGVTGTYTSTLSFPNNNVELDPNVRDLSATASLNIP